MSSNVKKYIGLDVHKEAIAIAVLNDGGKDRAMLGSNPSAVSVASTDRKGMLRRLLRNGSIWRPKMRRCPCESEGISLYGLYPRRGTESGDAVSRDAG